MTTSVPSQRGVPLPLRPHRHRLQHDESALVGDHAHRVAVVVRLDIAVVEHRHSANRSETREEPLEQVA